MLKKQRINAKKSKALVDRVKNEDFHIPDKDDENYEEGKCVDWNDETERYGKYRYSKQIKDLVQSLLTREPTKRLGHNNDADEILQHQVFKTFDLNNIDGKLGSPDEPESEHFKFQ